MSDESGETSAQHPVETADHAPVRERIENGVGVARELGVQSHMLERFLFWWKMLGLRRAAGLFVLVGLPVLNAEWTKHVAEQLVHAYAEYHDVELEVGEWDGSILGTHATAHNVVLKAPGPYAKAELFKADRITVQLSVWRRLSAGHWIKDITVDKPSVYVERTLAGRWNWSEVFDIDASEPIPGPGERSPVRRAAVGTAASSPSPRAPTIAADHIDLNDMRIAWVENIPGNSGGGLVNASTATLYVDDVRLRLADVGRPGEPMRVQLEGRTADGRISLDGRLLMSTSPSGTTSVYIENIGIAAFARLAPAALLMPVSGSVTGHIDLAVAPDRVNCRADLQVRGYQLAVSPNEQLSAAGRTALQHDLENFRADRHVTATCDGDPRREDYRLEHAVQAAVTRQLVSDAPPAVQSAALVDEQRVHGITSSASLQLLGTELARRTGIPAAHLLGVTATNGPETAATSQQQEAGSAFVRGIKGAGTGFKHLFGGGKNKPAHDRKR